MDVFKAFPNAISDEWEIGCVQKATEVGDVYESLGQIDVIVEVGSNAQTNMAPNADEIGSSTLLYARPEQLPTTSSSALLAGYLWYNTVEDQFYEIIDVGIGSNLENGTIEHIEFSLRPTEARYGCN